MTWSAAEGHDFLTRLIREGIKYGLENFTRLLEVLEHPERANRWIHVAGTNGKGSTSAMVESILRAAGEPTVLFTSPHLVSVQERFRVDGRAVDDAAFARATARLSRATATLESRGHEIPTFFEACTGLSFLLAAEDPARYGVAEVGLGGRLDATNLLTPRCALITSIGLDHTKTLGPTREHIAREKAGIAKEGVPLLVPDVGPGPLGVIEEHAARVGAPLEVFRPGLEVLGVDPATRTTRVHLETPRRRYEDLGVGLLGRHQARNAALAVRAVEVAFESEGRELTEDAVREGLATVRWPGRFDVREGEPLVVLDAVHNPEGMTSLESTWRDCFGDAAATVLFGACSDKHLGGMYAPLSRIARSITFATAEVRRSAPAEVLQDAWIQGGYGHVPSKAAETLAAAWERSRTIARNEGSPLLVCGSVYLLGKLFALEGTPDVDP